MKELVVVTFKMPADAWAKKMYGEDVEYIYDSVAFHDDSLSEIEIKKLRKKYSEVDTFRCTLADYDRFVDDEKSYEEFVRTGVCPLKTISEDVDVGTDSKTVNIECNVRIQRDSEKSSFDYNVDTDDVGQIVFTPYDVGTRFCHEGEDVVPGENVKFETVKLTAHMISDVDDYDYFMGTDDIGQFVITPIAEQTSFLSVSVNDSLNLVTEGADELDIDSDTVSEFNIGDRVTVQFNGNNRPGVIVEYVDHDPMDDFTGADSGDFSAWIVRFDDGTTEMIGSCYITLAEDCKELTEANKYRDFEWDQSELYAVVKNDGSYAGVPCTSYEEARQLAYHPGSKIFKLVLNDDATEEPLEEDLSQINRMDIVNKVMQGEISVFSGEGTPDPSMIHIQELDNEHGKLRFEYYYDEESNSVISYAVPLKGSF